MCSRADCLLLAGNCIVEEAVLTGESTPQWKLPVGGGGVSPAETLHIKSHRQHVLFGGTRVLQHNGDKAARLRTPDSGCLCVVLRTGVPARQGGRPACACMHALVALCAGVSVSLRVCLRVPFARAPRPVMLAKCFDSRFVASSGRDDPQPIGKP